MFDNVCKFLAETFTADFATWLLGQPCPLTQLSSTELSLEPIRADALILLQSEQLILHLEFQTDPTPEIPFRMADYRLRGHRRFPDKKMRQVVIYLRPSGSDLVQQTSFNLEETQHQFEVIRLWEQPTELFLQQPGLLPLAVLSQTSDPEQVLQAVVHRVEEIADIRERSNLAAASGILAGLLLEQTVIQKLLRTELMRESVIYQEIEAQGLQRGLQQGRQEGRQQGLMEGERALILRQISHRWGSISALIQTKIERLSLIQLEALGEALFDFTQLADLEAWLDRR
jgi:predicted transposase/invertase (TIGR01784 family)